MRVVRLSVLLAVLTVSLAVPLAVLAGGSAKRQAAPTFAFGRAGGNILPFTVTISSTGHVAAKGPVHVSATQASTPLRSGLAKLARAEGFFTMPTAISCGKININPDIAGRFVTVNAFGKSRTVTERGSCNAAFEELYAVLGASTGAGP